MMMKIKKIIPSNLKIINIHRDVKENMRKVIRNKNLKKLKMLMIISVRDILHNIKQKQLETRRKNLQD